MLLAKLKNYILKGGLAMSIFAKNRNIEEPILIIRESEDIKPKPHLAVVRSNPIESYEELSKELGFYPGQLLEEQVLRFFLSEGITVYNEDDVFNYLCKKVDESRSRSIYRWVWIPLREKDRDGGIAITGRLPRDNWCGLWSPQWDTIYSKLVPARTLEKVKLIESKFPDKLRFYVSDYVVPNPDPFIMVTAVGVRTLIFDVWDEPGF